jgi:hypothetical protein
MVGAGFPGVYQENGGERRIKGERELTEKG